MNRMTAFVAQQLARSLTCVGRLTKVDGAFVVSAVDDRRLTVRRRSVAIGRLTRVVHDTGVSRCSRSRLRLPRVAVDGLR